MTTEHIKTLSDPQREGSGQSLAEGNWAGVPASWPPAHHRTTHKHPIYLVHNNCFLRRFKRKIEILSNFTAWIVIWDFEGFLIEGRLDNGKPLPPVRVKSLRRNWTYGVWGLRAIVYPSRHQDVLRCILLGVAGGIAAMNADYIEP